MTAETEIPDSSLAAEVGTIPIRNVWLLFLYAYKLSRYEGQFQSEIESSPDLLSLVAKLLCYATEKRLRRQLSAAYQSRHATLRRVRGRIDLLETATHQLLERAEIACDFDELTSDTPRNRLIRAALTRLGSRLKDPDLAKSAKALARALGERGVSALLPSRSELAREQIARHDADDRLLVSLARAVFDLILPTETVGSRDVVNATRSEVNFPLLFEKAIAAFFQVELSQRPGWVVRPSHLIQWPWGSRSAGMAGILPSMVCDIVIENSMLGRRIVIDTKFMNILTPGRYGGWRLKSGNIFQVYSYLRSQESADDALSGDAEGILLHPAVGLNLDETAMISGHPVRFRTVDLSQPSTSIVSELRDLLFASRLAAGRGDLPT